MRILRQWAILIAVCFSGEILHKALDIPIPGNVLGMLIMFILLCTKVIKVEFIEESVKFLLDHLSFFFVPAGASLITSLDLLKGNWIKFITIIVVTTIIVQVITGHTVQLVNRLEEKSRKRGKKIYE